ncbi:MAG: hypothetical protein WDA22_16890 [Bacteroidota bacterium]
MTITDYLSSENQIHNELLECRRLFTHAVTDIPKYSTQEKIESEFPGFQREVFSAHKLALKILIDRILELENLLSEIPNINSRSPDTKTLKLHFWKHILELTFNTFVWLHLEMDRSNVRKVFKGPKYGDLSNQNIESVLQYINEENKDINKIAIPLDFCSFSPICDILQINYSESENVRHIKFIEAKSGKVNEDMLETINSKTSDLYFKFFDAYGKKGIKQMDRFFKQMLMLDRSRKLINAKPGVYENPVTSEPPLVILDNNIESIHFSDKITELLEKSEQREFAVDTIDECLVVGVLNRKDENILKLGEFDVRLYVYNCFFNPATLFGTTYPADLPEILNSITLVNWVEGFKSIVLEPVILRTLPEKHLMDLLLGKKMLKLYFNPESFIALCNKNGLKAEFTTKRETNHFRSRSVAKSLVEFNGRYIKLVRDEGVEILGDGTIYEMLFNWAHPTSLIEQMKQI